MKPVGPARSSPVSKNCCFWFRFGAGNNTICSLGSCVKSALLVLYWTPNLTVLNQFQPEAERGEGGAAGGQRPDAEDRHHLWGAPGRRLPRAAPPLLLLRLLQQAPLLDGQEAVQAAIQPGRKEDIYRVTHQLAD